jgi:hypothetical protein
LFISTNATTRRPSRREELLGRWRWPIKMLVQQIEECLLLSVRQVIDAEFTG